MNESTTISMVNSAPMPDREPEPAVRALGQVLGAIADLDEDETRCVLFAVAALYEIDLCNVASHKCGRSHERAP